MNQGREGSGRLPGRDMYVARERAAESVARCELQLRRAEESVRCAGEALRRSIRAAAEAEAELVDATRRLDRIPLPLARTG